MFGLLRSPQYQVRVILQVKGKNRPCSKLSCPGWSALLPEIRLFRKLAWRTWSKWAPLTEAQMYMCTLVLLTLSSVVEFSLQTICAGRAGVGENKEKQTRGWGSQDTLDCQAEGEGGLLFHNLLSKSPGYRRSFLCEVEQLRPQRFLVGDCYFHSVFYFLQTLRLLPLRLWKVLFWSKVWRRGGKKKAVNVSAKEDLFTDRQPYWSGWHWCWSDAQELQEGQNEQTHLTIATW